MHLLSTLYIMAQGQSSLSTTMATTGDYQRLYSQKYIICAKMSFSRYDRYISFSINKFNSMSPLSNIHNLSIFNLLLQVSYTSLIIPKYSSLLSFASMKVRLLTLSCKYQESFRCIQFNSRDVG